MRREIVLPPADVDLDAVAARATYAGSAEHKAYPSAAGPPRLRADASKCDPQLASLDELTDWLRAGIGEANCGAPWEEGFPKYVWYVRQGVCYEARLINWTQGQYKGYPLAEGQWPVNM
jgi:hypothetical protein